MKARRHHNNRGERQVRRGKTRRQVERIARLLRIPYGRRAPKTEDTRQEKK